MENHDFRAFTVLFDRTELLQIVGFANRDSRMIGAGDIWRVLPDIQRQG
jgi:hypothetical protein